MSLRETLEADIRTAMRAREPVVRDTLPQADGQSGRGIGIHNKLKAYALQDEGLDTVEANQALGFAPDLREYGMGAQMLTYVGVRRMKLLTNNPKKIAGLEGYGLSVEDQLPLETPPNAFNRKYLRTKRDKLGHLLDEISDSLG